MNVDVRSFIQIRGDLLYIIGYLQSLVTPLQKCLTLMLTLGSSMGGSGGGSGSGTGVVDRVGV